MTSGAINSEILDFVKRLALDLNIVYGNDVRSKRLDLIAQSNVCAIYEVAYQLAKMNERMDNEDSKFFGGLPSAKEKEKVQETKIGNEGTKQI